MCVGEQSTEGLHGPQREEEAGMESVAYWIVLWFLTPPPILFVDEIDENDLARARDMYGGKVHARFWLRNVKERDQLEDVSESERY